MATVQDFLAKVGVAAGGLIDNVVIETDITPRIVISQPLTDSGAPPNPIVAAIMSRIRPRAVVNYTAASGLPPLVVAPYGDPSPLTDTESNFAAVILAGVGVLSLVLMWRGLFCKKTLRRPPHTPLPGLGDGYRTRNSSSQKRKKGGNHGKR